jgi:competence protein ComEC
MKKLKRIIVLLIAISLLAVTNYSQVDAAAKYHKMTVHYIDVGESDCVLIQSDGKSMLIDAGETGDGDDIIDYLKDQKVEKLDYIICTHPHEDHIGGMSEVIEEFAIGKVLMPNKTHTTKTFENLLDTISDKKLKITKPVVGNEYSIGNAKFAILAPNHYDYGSNLNNYSIAIRLVNGKNSFLFIGDNETEAIEDILDNKQTLDSDVYMCGHHGSDTSTTKDLIKAVSPDYAIISVGKNSYGHPGDSTLKLLNESKIKTFRTDENGTIVVASTGKDISVNAKASTIKSEDVTTSDTVYLTKTGTKYHLDGCTSLRGSKIKSSVKEAKKDGYDPCSKCNPPE